jgi:hypothetical protein
VSIRFTTSPCHRITGTRVNALSIQLRGDSIKPIAESRSVRRVRAAILAALRYQARAPRMSALFSYRPPPRQKLNYHLRELEREGFLELIEERRKGNCMERVVRAVVREFLIAPQTGDRVTADRFSAAYLASTAARLIRELASLCIIVTPHYPASLLANSVIRHRQEM